MKARILILVLSLFFAIDAGATTWYRTDLACPLCGDTGEYQVIGSYGSYIYNWPSKHQLVFWPQTTSLCLYSCKECAFTVFMWDFDTLPENKRDTLEKVLEPLAVNKGVTGYDRIPMWERLEIAEKVYGILERDNVFWCRFYRVMAYHYDECLDTAAAYASRVKAINIAQLMLEDKTYAGQEKEMLFIIAAMYKFTSRDSMAETYFEKALGHKYSNPDWEPENNENYDDYLTDLINETLGILPPEEKKKRGRK